LDSNSGNGTTSKAHAPVANEDLGETKGTARLKIFRGDTDGGEEVGYEIPLVEGMVVLDAVLSIQAEQAPDLAVRWNCKAAHCGSCSAEINGRPALLCKSRVDEFEGEIHVGPMRAFPVIKDLVSDVSWNYEVSKGIKPFQSDEQAPFTMYEEDVERLYEPKKCIECFMCQDVCHVLRTHHKHAEFAGPRSSSGTSGSRCTRWTTRSASTTSRRTTASATATSPSAAPRCAPWASRSRTTPSSPSRSASPTSTTTRRSGLCAR
jgi:succinate dehydrogenase / fumarate reductase iron-sulfur subunit